MLEQLSGATRVHVIVGDPIAQVKSPFGMTQAFEAAGHNAICIPAHVGSSDLSAWWAAMKLTQNVDGMIITIPHKFACTQFCDTLSERAAFLGAVNVLRRLPDGRWQGDMFDGLGYVQALRKNGCDPQGKAALLIGAGGAGSAIAHGLVQAGVSRLSIVDPQIERCAPLAQRLNGLNLCPVTSGEAQIQGFDLVINATPMGMKSTDPLPAPTQGLQAQMHIGCVITAPAISPWIAQARAAGCGTTTGSDMFAHVRDLMVEFLLGR
jgi:shikimate dehydrogenase